MHAHIISRYLKQPKRQPKYRADRPHDDFLHTIEAPLQEMKQAITNAWHANTEMELWPRIPDGDNGAERQKSGVLVRK